MKKTALFLALILTLCACAPSVPTETDTTTKFKSAGFTLSVPNEYADRLIVDTERTAWGLGTFFHVSEKASVEAARELWPDDPSVGGGFLFAIGRVDVDAFHNLMMSGMTGADVFARDNDGNCYIYYHPTDVQLIRAGDYTDADWALWSELCEWADGIKQGFIKDNPGLSAYERTYSELDCALHYLTYDAGTAYLTKSGGDAVYTPSRVVSTPYLEQLLDDVLFYPVTDDGFALGGDYVTLTISEMYDHVAFDFFPGEGQQPYIRQRFTHFDDIEPTYYVASKNGETFSAGKVVSDWLDALA